MQKHTYRQGVAFDHWLSDYCIDKPDRMMYYLMQISQMVVNSQRKKKDQLRLKEFVIKPKRRPRIMTQAQREWWSEMAMAAWGARLGFGMDGKPLKGKQ